MIYRALYDYYPIFMDYDVSDYLYTNRTSSKEISNKHSTYGVYVNNVKICIVI
jgi:hypothetical protein